MLDTNVNNKFGKEGLTFDDVLLIPGESDCTPDMVDIHTHLTKDIVLNTPIMTSDGYSHRVKNGYRYRKRGRYRYYP